MVDIVIGTKTNTAAADALIEQVKAVPEPEATLYLGYPVVSTATDSTTIDAMLTSPHHGVIIFDFSSPNDAPDKDAALEKLADRQATIVLAIKSKLMAHRALTKNFDLAVPVSFIVFAILPTSLGIQVAGIRFASPENFALELSTLPMMDVALMPALNEALQHVSTIKPKKKRLNVVKKDSKGAILKEIEKEIANLDRRQKQGAIETPAGPQRIRGLAGSGKTIVLALKAAYLHALHPDWDIVVTFHTRALKGTLQEFIRRFSYEQTNDEPDWQKLRVLSSWGGLRDPGVYSEVAVQAGVQPEDFDAARRRFGRSDAFEGICGKVLDAGNSNTLYPLYDAILIDEAQDFGPNFLRLCLAAVQEPKRLIWAYDEMQNLNALTMPPLEELFGADEHGRAKVALRNDENQPRQDVILSKCYRNTPWALAVAHALGFGCFRPQGLIQAFDEPGMWDDIGYRIVSGRLEPGYKVSLARRQDASPEFFVKWLSGEQAVQFHAFDDDEAQLAWLVSSIQENLSTDELEPTDIMVIIPNPLSAQQRASQILYALRNAGIEAHIAGVTRSRDEFFVDGSIVLTGIFRAKGNECPMVYVVNTEYCYGGSELISKRNTLFTAMTRSRGWVRVAGVGEDMQALCAEYSKIVDADYELRFRMPTDEECRRMRQIHRDRTASEQEKLEKTRHSLGDFLEMLEAGNMSPEDLPPAMRARLKKFLT